MIKRTPQEVKNFLDSLTPKEKIMHEMVGKILQLEKEGRIIISDSMPQQSFSTEKYTFVPCLTEDLPNDTDNISIEDFAAFEKKCFTFAGIIKGEE